MTYQQDEEQAWPPQHETKTKFRKQTRKYLGALGDDDYDEIEFEEEFDLFERLRKRGRR